jgi:hypothetical protein|tara:strand:- start:2451 stop:2813 length:363 start_codon:yes stop_codon:yes gene_type:complete
MDFNLNGCIVEYRFAVKAMEREIEVSFPLLNTSVYDCVTNTDKGFKKIQIKSSSSTNEVARCYLYNTKKELYSTKTVDYFAIWINSHNGFYIIKNNGKMHSLTFRKNGKYLKNFNNFALL